MLLGMSRRSCLGSNLRFDDNVNRLTSELWFDADSPAIYAFEWDYDYVGNRTYQKFGADRTYYTYNGANELTHLHALDADTWGYFAYDSRGNCLRIKEPDGTAYFTYGDANLVTEIKHESGVMNYLDYDARRLRYAMQDSAGPGKECSQEGIDSRRVRG